jgi:hypothetical protein
MKSTLYFGWVLLPFVIAISKEFEAPVARRDADMEVFSKEKTSIVSDDVKSSEIMCGVYLCPSLPDHAVSYIQEGCQGTFTHWIQDLHQKQIQETQLIETISTSKEECIHLSTLIGLIGFSSIISFLLGWREHHFQNTKI